MTAVSHIRHKHFEIAAVQHGSRARHRIVQILFVHRDVGDVERYVQELKLAGFKVWADVALTPEQLETRLSERPYDLVVAEYPSPNWRGTQVLEALRQLGEHIPLIFVSEPLEREVVAELITRGAYDCIDREHMGHLPVALRRALEEGKLRGERDRAEKMLKHSDAKYRALIGNLTYGICRCSVDGTFLDVNQALMTMLGYKSRDELLAANHASAVFLDSGTRAQLLGQSHRKDGGSSFETTWRGNNGMPLTVRLSGREVRAEQGASESYEVIVEDVTKQRALENQLREQATRDALTGLANYRQLVDVLSIEIKRSRRTKREFALLLLDLDGLKQINDRHGHLAGSKALCRLADALCICSRDIDTAARFGGDEFAVVLPETGAGSAKVVAQRICSCLFNDAKEPRISVSVGVAIYPHDGRNIENLLRMADRALYRTKGAKGRAS
jgi:diguanylate cyclase (GGDEF)-like protein/PAS domain S-box-containing protein